jgi:hypothetical protein
VAKFWTQDGKFVVTGQGQAVLCDDCPCDAADPCPCCHEDTTPAVLRVTFADVADDECEDCAPFWNNTEFELVRVPETESPCLWQSAPFEQCGLECRLIAALGCDGEDVILEVFVNWTVGFVTGGAVFRRADEVEDLACHEDLGSLPFEESTLQDEDEPCDFSSATAHVTGEP